MKEMLMFVMTFFVVLTIKGQSTSPELISSGGDSFFNATYQINWSIGEIQIETYMNTSYILTQGFHQNTYTVTNIIDILESGIYVSVYPNPATDFINIHIEGKQFEGLKYILTDIYGKELETKRILSNIDQINFVKFPVGTYILLIKKDDQLVKSFKIVKI